MLYKNFQNNLVLQLDSNWTIQSVKVDSKNNGTTQTKLLEEKEDYNVEIKEPKLVLTLHNSQSLYIQKLVVNMGDENDKTEQILIKGIELACIHKTSINTCQHLSVFTHNAEIVSEKIHSITERKMERMNVQFLCGGTIERMSPDEYDKFATNYVNRYFTGDNTFIQGSIQFPPPILGTSLSRMTQIIKNAMDRSKYRLFTIITHYNTREHLKFWKLDDVTHLHPESTSDCSNRILLLYENTIINIRYTETKNAFVIQKEFEMGEEDLSDLSRIHTTYIQNGTMTLVNVVAAPEFENIRKSNICNDCLILSKNTLSDEKHIRDYFSNILHELKKGNSGDGSKQRYMSMISQIICFIATTDAKCKVPSLSEDVHDQVTSLMYTPQQLRILYDKSTKKIITGPLGSGKTVLALSHLELIYKSVDRQSIIFYVIWDGKTVLIQDVISHIKRLPQRSHVTVDIKNIVELAKDLKMSKVPTISQLLKSLVKKHLGLSVHLIVDELDGEMFDMKESSSLQNYFQHSIHVERSFVVLFPQSIERHRSLIEYENVTKQEKYKYEETGMELFELTVAMRTTNALFRFLKAFEDLVATTTVEIKLPVQETQQFDEEVNLTDSENVDGGMTSVLPQQDQDQHQPQKQEPEQEQQEKANNPRPESPQQQSEPQEHQQEFNNKQKVPTYSMLELQKDAMGPFESPFDIDAVAASMKDEELSKHVRTELELKFNSAFLIGHNIQGIKPRIIHPTNKKTTEDEFLVMLKLVLQDICLDHETKRLFIYNKSHQRFTFHKLLKLMEIDYFYCDESTQWKIEKSDLSMADFRDCANYNILTNHEGSRGIEAAQCICIMDMSDNKLMHLALEGMSRATQTLIIISTSNLSSADNQNPSNGYFLRELASEYLIEIGLNIVSNRDIENPYTTLYENKTKIVYNVNNRSVEYKDIAKEIKKLNCHQPADSNINAREIVFRNVYPPKKITDITCRYLSSTSCELTWQNYGYSYTLRVQERNRWKNVFVNGNSNQCIISHLVAGLTYNFCVIASNKAGISEGNNVAYSNKPITSILDEKNETVTFNDIKQLIKNDNFDEFKRVISCNSKIVDLRSSGDETPLTFAVKHSKNLSIIQLLIAHGSYVWANISEKNNSYHYAAWKGLDKVLEMLCEEDVSYINREGSNSWTPLEWAARFGNIACVEVLLRCQNIEGEETAFQYAATSVNFNNRKKIREIIESFMERKKKSKKD
ncbi:uncharacterized protein LOC130635930 isoform X2 [Hydractinia symbiolongicarpus]|nr:uncharacterized protein LOC130635930 isoform X2 [Hydractinia symbiolongicarpus]